MNGRHLVRVLLASLSACALLALGASVASAATFNWTVDCPPNTVVGPVTVLPFTFTGTVTVTPGVPVTVALLPTNNLTRVDNPAAPPGTFTGTLACTLTFGGVTVPFTRSFSLVVPPAPAASGLMTTGAATVIRESWSPGSGDRLGSGRPGSRLSRDLVTGGIIGVPLIVDTTVLLTPPPIPTLSTRAFLLMLAVLLGSALMFLRRGVAKRA